MPGVKGKTNNPNGRTKGVANIVSHEMREVIMKWGKDNFPAVVTLWNEIEDPAEKIKAYTNLIEFAMPRMARQEVVFDSEDETTGIRIEVVKSKKPE